MPGAVSQTSTFALTNTTIRYALDLADKGVRAAAKASKPLALGVNTFGGQVTYQPVAQAHGLEFVELAKLI
jgi:alanine dehydrogenase